MINTHTHLFQTFMKGLGEGLPLYDWLKSVTAPSTVAMTLRDGYLSAVLGLLEAARSGTTTVVDYMYPLPTSELYPQVVQAFKDVHLRGILGWGLLETGDAHGLAPSMFRPVSEALTEVDDFRAHHCNELITLALAPGITFGVTREGLESIRDFASERRMMITLHANETDDDNRANLIDHGSPLIPFLEEIGFLGPDVLAVHCVKMTPEDIECFARHKVNVCHNPIANMYLGSGAAPVVEMRRQGLNVGLGTDGAASNNSQDMLEVIKCTGLMHKMAHLDPSTINAAAVLDMATNEGAAAVGLSDRLGSLEPGKKADLFVLDPLRAKSAPVLDPVASLVFSAGEDSIVMTIVNGEIILEDGQFTTVDEPLLLQECQQAAQDLMDRAGTRYLLPTTSQ
jgi:5-methylthioadenosine/S-adenosylhomocysteine deaminase